CEGARHEEGSRDARLDTAEMITLERCLADPNAEEAFWLLKALAEKVRHAQFTS
ncbi:MAG: hypothetical protein IH608_10640, partial [Proteobacteria bacterium]|nr:hypothetical protein [Pseudomonadota bacterium]